MIEIICLVYESLIANYFTVVVDKAREYKIPFSMHVSGFKYREIAEKLGLPLGTVKSRIFFTESRGKLR